MPHYDEWTPPDTRHWVEIQEIVEKIVGVTLLDDEQDLMFTLQQHAENAFSDVAEALHEKRTKSEVKELELKAESAREMLDHATKSYIKIRTEIEAATSGESSVLKLVRASPSPDMPRVTKHSAYIWLHSEFGVTVPEWSPADIEQEEDKEPSKKEANELTKLRIMLAVLAKLYAEAKLGSRGTFESAIHKQIAADMAHVIEKMGVARAGFSQKTIEDKLNSGRQDLDKERKYRF